MRFGPLVLGKWWVALFVPSEDPGWTVVEYRLAPFQTHWRGSWWGWVQLWRFDPREPERAA